VSSPSTTSQSRAWTEVDLGALAANFARVQRAVGAATGIVPMVKANAYGLGAARVVRALEQRFAPEGGPWAFGVATVAEGEALRAGGWSGRAIVFAPCAPDEYERAASARLTLAVSSIDALRRWADAAGSIGERLGVHTEVDTGMGRAGFAWREAASWGEAVARTAARLRWEGCFTHFHSADEPDLAPTHEQWARFQSAAAALPAAPAGEPRLLHVANSAAALRCAGFGCDLARPGIALYGGSAGPGTAGEPVLALRARLVLVREVEPGASAGYGATYRASGRERWGTVGIGYGDGLRRALAAGGEALVRGRRVPIIGRISMDMTTLDLTHVRDAREGDVVTFIGADGAESILLDEVAARCGTISYEVLTGLTARLPRLYHGLDGAAG
jgi:alanine racemase